MNTCEIGRALSAPDADEVTRANAGQPLHICRAGTLRRHLSPRQELDRGRVCPRLWAGAAVTGCKEHGAPKTVSRKLDCPATSLDRPTYRAPRKAGW